MARKVNLLLAGAGLILLAGCQTSEKLAATPAGPNVVNVVAKEYRYEMPDSIPAGPTLFHLTDEGSELHHMTLVKLEDGKTLADLATLPPGPMPSWAVFMGGPNAPMPHGGQSWDVVDLSPGNYAVICLVPGQDGKLHMTKGMRKALTVTASSEARAMPASDLTLTLADYRFVFSRPVTAGKHAIRVVNNGPQMHEAEIFKLQPGKTGGDVLMWVGGGFQGPPPGMPVGGAAPETQGRENIMMVDLAPGNYAVLCFMPDAHDGKPHAMHGMIHDFQVL
jgi:hypothetical protein